MSDQSPLKGKGHLQRKSSIISSSSLNSPTKLQAKKKQQIDRLLNRFLLIDRNIEIDINKANFNLISYQLDPKNEKIKYDPQMMSAKLRQLQNKAQIDRANMEITNREKKRHHSLKRKKPQNEQNYKKIYEKFLQNQELYDMPEHDSDDQLDAQQKAPVGIKYYSYLKKHPKIVEYTLEKQYIRSKQDQIKKAQTARMIAQLRNTEGKPGLLTFYQASHNIRSPNNEQHNPQKILDSQYHKFFSKKRNDKLSQDTKSIDRCSKMLDKQSQILNEPESGISEQNKKKMIRRFNQIVNQIARGQRKEKDHMRSSIAQKTTTLPKLEDMRSVSLKKQSMMGSTDSYL